MSEQLANLLRAAIEKSGKSHNAISRETGVPQPTITRFVNGADMRLSSASVLAEHFGLRLIEDTGTPQKRKR